MKPAIYMIVVVCACGDDARRTPDSRPDSDVTEVEDAAEVDADAPVALALGDEIPAGRVIAGVATRVEHLVQGPKAEGMLGDLVLENARARFVVEGARRGGGYRMWGGHLIDVAVDGRADRYGEAWLAWNLNAFVPEVATVVSDGADGIAHVRIAGHTGAYPWPDSFLRPLLNPPPADLAVTYDYRLAPDEARLALTITLDNSGGEDVELELPLIAINMGDGAKSFAPGGGFGGVQSGVDLPWVGAVGGEASYAVAAAVTLDGVFSYSNVDIVTLPETTIAAGASATFELAFLASADGTPGLDALGGPAELVEVSGSVDGAPAGAWVAVTDGERVAALTLVEDGRFSARVPSGEWSVQAFASGVGGSAMIEVTAPDEDVALVLPEPATLSVTIRDSDSGEPIPAQLTLFREPGTSSPFAPGNVRLDRDWGSDRSAVIFAVAPDTVARVPPGEYLAVASRGYSYEIAELPLDLEAGATKVVDLTIERAVDTSGWAAADFHLHAQWSSDSDVSYHSRVCAAAANDVALPVLTEHAYVGDLLSAAELAGVSEWVVAIPAQEVTTFEYGHFNAFPLVYDPDAPSGGAVFEHGRAGAELFDAIHAQQPDEVIIQVNHPRSQAPIFAYFDYIALDATTGIAAKPARFSDDWDMIEVFNGSCGLSTQNERALQDWIGLTNAGWKKTLSSGSDSHSEAAGVGHPRSWIEVDAAAVVLDPQAIVAPLRARRTFVSCGPFVRFAAADGTGMGGLATLDGDGRASFAVTVEAPTWMHLVRVDFRENGVVIDTFTPADPARGTDPERPALRFDGAFEASPAADAWYAVEVIGTDALWPIELGDVPYALTNAIEVDADGDGAWSPPGKR